MGRIFKWAAGIAVPLVIAAGALLYFGQGLKDSSLERFDIDGLEAITADSFTITGNFYIKNPSEISVPVESITYNIILKETGENIGSGAIPSFNLEANKVSRIPFKQQVRWIPTADMAARLATKDKVLVIVKGEIRINLPKVREHPIPFSEETDIKEYIMQFVPSKNLPDQPVKFPIENPGNENPDNPSNPLVPGII